MTLRILSIIYLFSFYLCSAQEVFFDTNDSEISFNTERFIVPKKFRTLGINKIEIEKLLEESNLESQVNVHESNDLILLPLPNGENVFFRFVQAPIMSPVLSAKYPKIKTYLGESIDHKMTMRFNYNPELGFHAMIMGQTDVIFIDPYSFHNNNYIISYYKKDYENDTKSEFHEEAPISSSDYEEYLEYKAVNPIIQQNRNSGDQLKSYRIAIACTQQYSNFHGGTTEETLDAIVTTMNRINQVYETELAIRLILVDNNDSLINLSVSAGMSNNNTNQLINQSQEVIDEIIGSENYDIGHTFSTGAGGLASLGVPCNDNEKAKGVTGTNSPVGDPFDIDYVAHEIGHQFGGNHTFNGTSGSCNGNRNEVTAYEPGSGSTIMAYAGICSSQNLQSNSDPYFHATSYDEIQYYINSAWGQTCVTISETGNSIPEASIEKESYIIPVYTAFELDGVSYDNDEDELSHSWEQMDLGPAGHPNSPSTNAPIFRVFNPTESTKRTFPRMSYLLNNSQPNYSGGETIPTYARTLHFRFTVRDNRAGGGGISYDQTEVEVTEQAGPFEIISPNGNETLGINETYNVEWEVADTDENIINCQEINIILMHNTNGTWEETILAQNEQNDGQAQITIPNTEELIGSQNRIKIVPTNNIFLDISDDDFSITGMNIWEISGGNVEIYPNPNNGIFTLRMINTSPNNMELIVYNIFGEKVHYENFKTSNNLEKEFNFRALNSGLYYIELKTTTEKVIKTISIL